MLAIKAMGLHEARQGACCCWLMLACRWLLSAVGCLDGASPTHRHGPSAFMW